MGISLVAMSQSPQDAPQALSWALELWGDHYPNYSHQDWANFYTPSALSQYESWEGNGQEIVFMAKRADELVGTIALVDFDDLEEFRHLKPWIAAFIVNPQLRGEGIGTTILNILEERAVSFGVEALYLWTEDQSAFYNKRGFHILATSKLGNLDIDVMRKSLVNE